MRLIKLTTLILTISILACGPAHPAQYEYQEVQDISDRQYENG